jgi:hypothetical protein
MLILKILKNYFKTKKSFKNIIFKKVLYITLLNTHAITRETR